jgi:toxin ParE1/3/4
MIYQVRLTPAAEADIGSAFDWYQSERNGLGLEFLYQLYAVVDSLEENPLKYQTQKELIRRVLLRKFPYAVYFVVEQETVAVIAVLHAAQNPITWQRRKGYWISEGA